VRPHRRSAPEVVKATRLAFGEGAVFYRAVPEGNEAGSPQFEELAIGEAEQPEKPGSGISARDSQPP
jgi:hypothetical protein